MLPVEVSDWRPAPFAVNGETVFAVGDVHGCLDEMTALLDTIERLAAESSAPRRLVYLGDMIDRGPDTIGVLKKWAEPEAARGVERIERVIGNHEILMLLAIRGEAQAERATNLWLGDRTGGAKVLAEMRAAVRDPNAPPSYALAAALGETVMRLMLGQRSLSPGQYRVRAWRTGRRRQSDVSRPWTAGATRWAWITKGPRLAGRLRGPSWCMATP